MGGYLITLSSLSLDYIFQTNIKIHGLFDFGNYQFSFKNVCLKEGKGKKVLYGICDALRPQSRKRIIYSNK